MTLINFPVNVMGYDWKKTVTCTKTVLADITYDDPNTGEVIISILHQAIYIPEMEHTLLCPMQIRLNDVELLEVPKFLEENPSERTHAIVLHSKEMNEPYIIFLMINGVTSYFQKKLISLFYVGVSNPTSTIPLLQMEN